MNKTMNVIADEDGTIKHGGLHEDQNDKMFIRVNLMPNREKGYPKSYLYHVEKDTVVEDGKSVKKGDLLGTYEGPGFILIGARRTKPAIIPPGVVLGEDVEVNWDCDLFGSDGIYYTLQLSGMFGEIENTDFYNLAGVKWRTYELMRNDTQDEIPIPYEDRKDLEELRGKWLGLDNNTGKTIDEHLRPGPDELSRRIAWMVVNDMKTFRPTVNYMVMLNEYLEKEIYDVNCEREVRGFSEIC